ncbi:MAG: hypothetical protein ACR2QG_03625 [Gammaproteobacteria bacterium]
MANKQRKLSNLLLNSGIQLPIILLVLLAGFLTSLFNAVLYYRFVKGNYDIFFASLSEVPQDFIDEKYFELINFGWSLIAISGLMTIVVALYALIITHRAAGAGYRIHAVVEEFKSGKTDARIHLRKNDYFQDLAQSINELMDQATKKG